MATATRTAKASNISNEQKKQQRQQLHVQHAFCTFLCTFRCFLQFQREAIIKLTSLNNSRFLHNRNRRM